MGRTSHAGRAAALLVALTLSTGCRTGVSEARFEAWDTRVEALIELASSSKDACAELSEPARRVECIGSWDAVLRALIVARAAGASAYLAQDRRSLVSVERAVDELIAQLPALAGPGDDPDGDGVVTR